MNRVLTTARTAGLLYLTVAICGGFAEIVRQMVIESGDAAATAENIRDAEWLFRVGFASDTVTFAVEVALAAVFYLLFRPVNHTLALMQALFRLAQAAAVGINLLNQFMALLLLSGEDYLTAFNSDQIDSLVLLFLEAHSYGYLIGLVFFAFATLVLGYLALRSGYVPAILALLLMVVVPLGYLLDSYTSFFIDDKPGVLSVIFIVPAALAELSFIAWLLVRGGDPRIGGEPVEE